MSLTAKLLSASGGGVEKLYVDAVFSAYTYTGNGSTQTINNGIELGDSSIWTTENANALPLVTNGHNNTGCHKAGVWIAAFYLGGGVINTTAIARSTDGITWTLGSTGVANGWGASNAGTTNFVIAAQANGGINDAAARYSSDGLTWVAATGVPTNFDTGRVSYANSRFFIGMANAGTTILMSSNEGMSFSSITVPTGSWSVASNGTTYVAMNSAASGCIYSTDLVNWTATSTAIVGTDIVFGNGVYVSVGGSGIQTSSTGIGWALRLSGVSFTQVLFSGNTFVAVSSAGAGVYTSQDGVIWAARPNNGTVSRWGAFDGAKVVIGPSGAGARYIGVANSYIPSSLGKGGLVWTKARNVSNYGAIVDTVRGSGFSSRSPETGELYTWNTQSGGSNSGQQYSDISSFNNDGYSLGYVTSTNNNSGNSYASWTFRRAPKFFDVVTYTGNGVAGREIPHELGIAPGMVIVKQTNAASNWIVYHRMLNSGTNPESKYLVLNSTNAEATTGNTFVTAVSTATFTINGAGAGDLNINGATYVAYLFAHDDSADGIIQCGSFTTDGSGNATVNLGWEPQYLKLKNVSSTENWLMADVMRGMPVMGASTYVLHPNTSGSETNYGNIYPTQTGFSTVGALQASRTYIYLAIRRPNKPPTTGTEVYNAIARTGTGAATTVTGVGFDWDTMLSTVRTGTTYGPYWFDKLRGAIGNVMTSTNTAAETYAASITSYDSSSLLLGAGVSVNGGSRTYINHFFKRAPGFFDVVCYTGTGVARTVPHSLGVAPELIIVKTRSITSNWLVYSATIGPTQGLLLNSANSLSGAASWNNTSPSATTFSLSSDGYGSNDTGVTYVAYLFATKAGISKVGSYTGNGTSQTIDAGFTTGSRFVMIKRTDEAGDWYVWDTVRGIVAGNDPHLSLNSNAAEITTDDSLDPASVGFIVNQLAATNINVTSASYIYLSFA